MHIHFQYWSHEDWQARVKKFRKKYASHPEMLKEIVASSVRPNWAEVYLAHPPGTGGEKCVLLVLMRFPDGKWRLVETTSRRHGPREKLGVYMGSVDVGGRFRRKVFEKGALPGDGLRQSR